MSDNIIKKIFNSSFSQQMNIDMDLLQSKYEMKFETLKIDTQDIALLETISDQDIKEISEKIFNKTNLYLNNLKSRKINDEELNEIIEIFFHEIVESIDYVYNLIISKQLGG
jgi:methionine synthase I (cobalamin-dependent)